MWKVGPGLFLRSSTSSGVVAAEENGTGEAALKEEGGGGVVEGARILEEERELEGLGLQSKRVEVRKGKKASRHPTRAKRANAEGEIKPVTDTDTDNVSTEEKEKEAVRSKEKGKEKKGKGKKEKKEKRENGQGKSGSGIAAQAHAQWIEESREFMAKALAADGAVLVEGDPAAACGVVLACLLLFPRLTRPAPLDGTTDASHDDKTKKGKKGKKQSEKKKSGAQDATDDEPAALTYDAALALLESKCGAPLPALPRSTVKALKAIIEARSADAAARNEQTPQSDDVAAAPVAVSFATEDAPSTAGEAATPVESELSATVATDIEQQPDAIPNPAAQRATFFSGVLASLRRNSKTRSNESLPTVKRKPQLGTAAPAPLGPTPTPTPTPRPAPPPRPARTPAPTPTPLPTPTPMPPPTPTPMPPPTPTPTPEPAPINESRSEASGSGTASASSSPAPRRALPPAAGNLSAPTLHSSADTPASWFNSTSGQPQQPSSAPHDNEPLAYVRRNNRTDKPDPSDRIYKIGDLPRDVRSQVLATKIPFDELERHFDIVLNILYFNKKVELPRRTRRTTQGEQQQQNQLRASAERPAEPDVPPPGPKFVAKTEEELLNTTINPKKAFKFLCMSGEGGYGKVWTAKSDVPEFKGKVAIKRLQHVEPKEKKHNVNEMSFLAFCQHPNIVTYHTSLLVKNELMIVMEHMEGGTLTEATKGHNFTEMQIAFVARELLSALVYLHDNKLAHRDLKSGNIMMTIKGQVKLIDFGLCVDVSPGPRNDMVGSPFWMAPEMVARRAHSTPVDIWSFAISLLELANKDPPHRKSSIKCMFTFGTVGCPDPLNEPAKWSATFKDFLAQCLQVDPAQRATARQLLRHPFVLKTAAQKQMAQLINQIFMQTAISQVIIT